MNSLRFTSCHAPNLDPTCRTITQYISERLALHIELVDDIDWADRYARLDRGEIDIAWICGLPYVRRADQANVNIELLAAPIWRGERYQGYPIYYSDVVVRRESRFQNFDQLQGAAWVYNDHGSLSGYAAMRHYLITSGKSPKFFGATVESGGHLKSLQMLLDQQADVAAIDSIVLEQQLHTTPELADQLRIITTIGPNPAMPWVIARHVPITIHGAIRALLLNMQAELVGQTLLAQGPIAHFAPVTDQHYNPIREILHSIATS
ncbi:hypothetical protein BH10CHL1_BH10CHL1_09070 [soil metagenome]